MPDSFSLLPLLPFVLLLLCIALLPLVAGKVWDQHRSKLMVSALVSLPCIVSLVGQGSAGTERLLHALDEYTHFICLLSALYAISGVIVVHGDLPRGPVGNTLWMALGAVLSNLLGTTGASMLLVRPLLRANHQRRYAAHVPLFFIFVVANCGGLLLPLGDPPLFLGFLEGVDFFFTLRLWPHWLLVNGLILTIFIVWDTWAWQAEPVEESEEKRVRHPLHVQGLLLGVPLLGAVMATLLLRSPPLAHGLGDMLRRLVPTAADPLVPAWAEVPILATLAGLAALSIHRTPREARALVWGPLVEVAILFAGLFVTMVPALDALASLPALSWTEARLLWATGSLSSVLDNAPTYLAFSTLADPHGPSGLVLAQPRFLQAISCGAVWMGALTYIGNGPNFLIRSIAEHMSYPMPSFFGYLGYSLPVLLPVFTLAMLLLFW